MEKSQSSNQDDTNYIFSESPVSYSNNMSIDKIIDLGKKIWIDVKKETKNIKTDKEKDELYNILFNKYKDFASSFNIVFKWMVMMNIFNERAFKKYLYKYSSTNISSKKEFIIIQAEYLVFLYEDSKHYDNKMVNRYRDYLIKQLLEEEEEFEKIQKELESELNNLDNEKRKDLYEHIKNSINK